MKLTNKIAIITGAASGIGKTIAERFVAEGANVAIADLNLDAANATAKELSAKGPGKAMGVKMDVTDETVVNAGVTAVVSAWGSVDILVSNAGIQIVHKLEEYPFVDWKKCSPSTSTARFSPPRPVCRTCTPRAQVQSFSWVQCIPRKHQS